MPSDALGHQTLDISRLTVPQLKARCKELKISGYSKLGKNALLQTLTDHGRSGTDSLSKKPTTAVSQTGLVLSESPKLGIATSTLATLQATVPHLSTDHSTNPPNRSDNAAMILDKDSATNHELGNTTVSNPASLISKSTTLLTPGIDAIIPNGVLDTRPLTAITSSTKRKTSASTLLPNVSIPAKKRKQSHPLLAKKATSHPANIQIILSNPQISSPHLQQSPQIKKQPIHIAGNRFKPLLTTRTIDHQSSCNTNFSEGNSEIEAVPTNSPLNPEPFLTTELSLRPITLPPSISKRKHVQSWAVILSAVSREDRRSCVLVSRMLRYAIYLSATTILSRDFPGKRLAQLVQKYPVSMTNFWPYLEQRRLEHSHRLNAYHASFLALIFHSNNPISRHLWKCPDHENQITIALRFVLSRMWFLLSVGGVKAQHWTDTVITDAQEIVKGEIWSITVTLVSSHSPGSVKEQVVYVLESTCEVIGHAPPARDLPIDLASNVTDEETSTVNNLPLRVDWSEYVQFRLLPTACHTSPPPAMISYLKSTNGEEYDRGISKIWLSKVAKEGSVGVSKRTVAERYIMACVVGHSVSGKWMSSTQMAQDISGICDFGAANRKRRKPQVNLFLPAHHHVESLHFTTSSGAPLHQALAIVQTPGREYYILRENGMEVGCEEDGIWAVWMKVLNCTGYGTDI